MKEHSRAIVFEVELSKHGLQTRSRAKRHISNVATYLARSARPHTAGATASNGGLKMTLSPVCAFMALLIVLVVVMRVR